MRSDLQADIEKKLAEIDRRDVDVSGRLGDQPVQSCAGGEWFAVSRAVAEVVAASREISEKSGGAQDITVGPLVHLVALWAEG